MQGDRGLFQKGPQHGETLRDQTGRRTFSGDIGVTAEVGRKSGKHGFRETEKREFEERSVENLNRVALSFGNMNVSPSLES